METKTTQSATAEETLQALTEHCASIIRPGFYDLPIPKAIELARASIELGFDAFSVYDTVIHAQDEHDSGMLFRTLEGIEAYTDMLDQLSRVVYIDEGYILRTINKTRQEHAYITHQSSYHVRRKKSSRHIQKQEVRERVFAKCGGKCCACGTTNNLTVDHILSVFNGGGDDDENLQALCAPCNSSKGVK